MEFGVFIKIILEHIGRLVRMSVLDTEVDGSNPERRMQPARGRFARFDLDRQIASTFPALY